MQNLDQLKATLKQAAQTTCDECGAKIEFCLHEYLVDLDEQNDPCDDPESDYSIKILLLMKLHECTFSELVKVYQSLDLNVGSCYDCLVLPQTRNCK